MKLSFGEVQSFVSDLDAARKFYEGSLGLSLVEESAEWLIFDISGNEFIVFGGAKQGRLRGAYGTECGTVLCLSTDDIHRDFDALKASGVAFFSEVKEVPEGWYVGFQDPDGNLLELVQRRKQQ